MKMRLSSFRVDQRVELAETLIFITFDLSDEKYEIFFFFFLRGWGIKVKCYCYYIISKVLFFATFPPTVYD